MAILNRDFAARQAEIAANVNKQLIGPSTDLATPDLQQPQQTNEIPAEAQEPVAQQPTQETPVQTTQPQVDYLGQQQATEVEPKSTPISTTEQANEEQTMSQSATMAAAQPRQTDMQEQPQQTGEAPAPQTPQEQSLSTPTSEETTEAPVVEEEVSESNPFEEASAFVGFSRTYPPYDEATIRAQEQVEREARKSAKAEEKTEQNKNDRDTKAHAVAASTPQMPQRYPEVQKMEHYFQRGKARKRKRDLGKLVAQRTDNGSGVYGKLLATRKLRFNEVGLGMLDLEEMMRDPTSVFASTVANHFKLDPAELDNAEKVARVLNQKGSKFRVTCFKAPNLNEGSANTRILRIVEGSGIFLHPTMSKMYNADFDGDEMTITLNKVSRGEYSDAMGQLISIEGKPAIDLDFWPILPFEDENKRDLFRQAMNNRLVNVIYNKNNRYRIINDAIDMSESYSNGEMDFAEEYLGHLIQDTYSLTGESFDTTSDILTEIYNTMHEVRMLVLARQNGGYTQYADRPNPRDSYERDIMNFEEYLDRQIDGMISGQVPMNMQDLKTALNAFIGEIGGKNITFRFTANIAKMYRFDDRVTFDTEEGRENAIYQMMSFLMSKKISQQANASNAQAFAGEYLRTSIISRVGFPDSRDANGNPVYTSFKQWVAKFASVYQDYSSIINLADDIWNTDMSYAGQSRKNTTSAVEFKTFSRRPVMVNGAEVTSVDVSVKELVAAFARVYKDYSMDRFLSFDQNQFITISNPNVRELSTDELTGSVLLSDVYQNRSVQWFSRNNRIPRMSIRERDKNGRFIRDNKGKFQWKTVNFSKTYISDPDFTTEMFVNALADLKSSTFSTYNTKMYGGSEKERNKEGHDPYVMELAFRSLQAIKESMGKLVDREDLSLELIQNEVYKAPIDYYKYQVRLLASTGPDLFEFFKMDNMAAFFTSKYGKAMLKAKTVDELSGIRFAMVAEYRLSRMNNASTNLRELINDNADESAIMRASNDLMYETEALRSSSDVWNALVVDKMAKEDGVFKKLIADHETVIKEALGTKEAYPNFQWGEPFYQNLCSKYDCALDLLLDASVSKSIKEAVISDVTRVTSRNRFVNSWDIAYKLEQDPAPAFSHKEPGTESVMDVANASIDAYRGYKQFPFSDYLTKKESDFLKENFVVYDNYIAALQKNPYLAYQVNDGVFGDALCSTLDKAYDQSEKLRVHPWTQALYSSLANTIHGGIDSDVYRGDNKIVGLINVSKLSARNLLDLVLDENGAQPYDQEGNLIDVPEAVRLRFSKYFIESICSSTCVPIAKDIEGNVSFIRTATIQETLADFNQKIHSEGWSQYNEMTYAKNVLIDHPTFDAMIALLNPTKNRSSRTMRNDYIKTRDDLCTFFCELGNRYKRNKSSVNIKRELNTYLGISKESIVKALLTNKNLSIDEEFGLSDGADWQVDEYAENLFKIILDASANYVHEMAEFVDGNTVHNIKPLKNKFAMDFESCSNFFDIRQELNGAKVGTAVGVEGNETWNYVAPAFLLDAKDRYTSLKQLGAGQLQQLIEANAMTNMGPIAELDINRLSVTESENLVIQVPEGFEVQDKSLDDVGNQTQTLGAFLIIKRDNGAEAHNAKLRKYGCDDMDSITKYIHGSQGRMNVSYGDLRAKLSAIYANGGNTEQSLFEARLELAKQLKDGNEAIGYKDMSLANYMNLAELMVVPDPNSKGISLRSIEMILERIKDGLTPSQIDELTLAELRSKAWEAADFIPRQSAKALAKEVRGLRFAKTSGRSTSLRITSSSWSRNLVTLKEIINKYPTRTKPPTDAACRQQQSQVLKANEKDVAFGIIKKGLGDGMIITNDMSDPATTSFVAFGPRYVQLLTNRDNPNVIRNSFNESWRRGNTVVLLSSLADMVPEGLRQDLIPCPGFEGQALMLPMFDMRQNGAESFPTEARPAFFVKDPNGIVVSAEDDIREFGLGDSQAIFFSSLVDRIKPRWTKTISLPVDQMFPNVNLAYHGKKIRYSLLSEPEVRKLIVEGKKATIDYGVTALDTKRFEKQKKRIDKLIDDFAKGKIDEKGFAVEAKVGGIVGWACATVYNNGQQEVVLAPIIPFQQHQRANRVFAGPRKYKVQSISFGDNSRSRSTIDVQVEYSGSIKGAWIKIHEGAGAANKMTASITDIRESPKLKNGIPVDMAVAASTTASRRGGSDRRIKTMESMVAMLRLQGYNYAEAPTSFPDSDINDPESLKNRLRTNRITIEEWESILQDPAFRFDSDPTLNTFIKLEAQKFLQWGANPSDFLASHFYNENGEFYPSCVWWEFAASFKSTRQYEDCLLKFFNAIDPDFCPAGLDADYNGSYFRVCTDPGYNYGSLQMEVPHITENGTFYTWQNVYAGWTFVGNEYSGFRAVNANGASNYMDALNMLALSGNEIADDDVKALLKWSLSDRFDARSLNSYIEVVPGDEAEESED